MDSHFSPPPGYITRELPHEWIIVIDGDRKFACIPEGSCTPDECGSQPTIPVSYIDEFELLSGYRLRWRQIVCCLSEDQYTAMRSILDGDGSFATLGELIYDDSFHEKKPFYDLAGALRKKFKKNGIRREIRPRNQRLVITNRKK